MDSKERVSRAVRGDRPDRAPVFLYNRDFGQSDIIATEVVRHWAGAGCDRSEWGFQWERLDGTMGQPKTHPLRRWEDIDTLRVPDAAAPGRFAGAAERMAEYPGKYHLASLGLSGFTVMTMLRGFTETLEELYTDKEHIERLADTVFGFERDIISRVRRHGFDGVAFFDDWGTQNSLILSPALFREIFLPRYSAQFRLCHDCGLDVYFHSCGYIEKIIPDLIEAGVDMLNLSQPNLYDMERLGAAFGGNVCFVCPVSYQTTSLTGTREQIFRDVETMIRNLGTNGRFIGYVEEYASIGLTESNYQSCIDAFRELGRYR